MRNDFCSNYLEHSAKGTSWRKKGAKYLSRVWKNGRWVYEYRITGKGYKREAEDYKTKSKRSAALAKFNSKVDRDSLTKSFYNQRANSLAKDSSYNGRKAAEAESNYKTKSLAGIAESTIKRGQNAINRLLSNFKTTETVTITSNLYPAGTKKVIKKK